MKSILIFIIACFSIVILNSCEFDFDREYLVNVSNEPKTIVSIDLLGQQDTFSVLKETEFKVKFETNAVETHHFKVSLDERLLGSFSPFTKNEYSFFINPYYFANGYHTLKVEAYTSSNTGSLADKLGVEQIVFSKKWIVQTDTSLPKKLKITSVRIENGSLVIEWEKNPNLTFEKYVLSRWAYMYNETYATSRTVEIADKNVTKFIDTKYIGGEIQLYIQNYGHNKSVNGDPVTFNTAYPILEEYKKNNSDTIFLKWKKTLIYSNFKSYTIKGDYSYKLSPYFGKPYFNSNNINDTSCFVKIGFGKLYTLVLSTASGTSTEYNYERLESKIEVYAGQKSVRGIVCNANVGDYVYIKGAVDINVLSLATNKIEHSVPIDYDEYTQIIASPNGKYVFFGSTRKNSFLDPQNLNTIKDFEITKFYPKAKRIYPYSLSNNGTLTYLIYNFDGFTIGNGSYNFQTSDTLSYGFNDPFTQVFLSPNEKYAFVRRNNIKEIYNYDNGQLKKIGDINKNFICFGPKNEDNYFSYDINGIYLMQCSDNVIIENYLFPVQANYNNIKVDPVTGKVLLVTSSKAYIIDIKQSKAIQTIDIIDYVEYNDYFLYNNEIFSRDGYHMKLNN